MKVGVTARAVQLIEADRKVPKTATMEAMITALGIPADKADALRGLRAAAQAVRDGLSVEERDGHQIERLAQHVTATAVMCLRRHGVSIPGQLATALHWQIEVAARAVLEPGVCSDDATKICDREPASSSMQIEPRDALQCLRVSGQEIESHRHS